MEGEPRDQNQNHAFVFASISGICGAVIAGALTAGQPDNTAFEIIRNAIIGGGLAPVLVYGAAFVVELFATRK